MKSLTRYVLSTAPVGAAALLMGCGSLSSHTHSRAPAHAHAPGQPQTVVSAPIPEPVPMPDGHTVAWSHRADAPSRFEQWKWDMMAKWAELKQYSHDNEQWPEPYASQAAESYYRPLDTQADLARRESASVWDYHFDPATGRLNPMGTTRIANIMNQTADLGTTVFVARSANPTETQLRIDAVKNQLGALGAGASEFQVVETSARPSMILGREAQEAVNKLLTPTPLQDPHNAAQPPSPTRKDSSETKPRTK